MTIVSADASPVETIKASALGGCIDVNSGQRYDVLLRANQPAGNYWISTRVQYRNGSPAGAKGGGGQGAQPARASPAQLARCRQAGLCTSYRPAPASTLAFGCASPRHPPPLPAGYAVLQYKGAKPGLPKTPAPQPGAVAPWTTQQAAKIVMSSAVLGKTFTKEQEEALYPGAARKVGWGGAQGRGLAADMPAARRWRCIRVKLKNLCSLFLLAPPHRQVPAATLDLRINITQPLMHQTGQLRWALNNVAGQVPAPCTPLLDLLYE